jgi:hypothetical protein
MSTDENLESFHSSVAGSFSLINGVGLCG